MKKLALIFTSTALALLAAAPLGAGSAPSSAPVFAKKGLITPSAPEKSDSLIVLYSSSSYKTKSSAERVKKLINGTVNLRKVSQIGSGSQAKTMEVWQLPVAISDKEVGGWAQEIKQVLGSTVQAVELNSFYRKNAVPTISDPGFAFQWHLTPSSSNVTLGSTDVAKVWDVVSSRGQNAVVAVIDDGIVAHKDLVSTRVLPGRGFISAPQAGDTDPTSPINPGLQCNGQGTVWHGLSMSLLVGADINGKGTVGAAPLANILPIRALGECGGFLSDIADSITWAAGGTVPGVPNNPFPADVINMSLGDCNSSTGTCPVCPTTLQTAINFALSKGAIPVASAGNESINGAIGSPANCTGVIAVQGHNEDGSRSFFSNTSASAVISSPAGGPYANNTAYSQIVTGSNAGGQTSTGAGADIDVTGGLGTSQASAITSGVIAVAKALNKSLDSATVASLLKQSAKAYPTGSFCDTNASICAKGLLDANAFLSQVAATVGVYFTDNPHTVSTARVGASGTISSDVSSLTGKALSYAWSSDQGVPFTGQGTKSITFTTPANAPFSSTVDLTFQLTVTDSAGNTYKTSYQVDLYKAVLTTQDASFTLSTSPQAQTFDLPITAEAGVASITLIGAPAEATIDSSKKLSVQNLAVGSYNFSYVVTDNDGQQSASKGITLTVNAAPTAPAPSSGGGGGGGGSLPLAALLVQMGVLLAFRVRASKHN